MPSHLICHYNCWVPSRFPQMEAGAWAKEWNSLAHKPVCYSIPSHSSAAFRFHSQNSLVYFGRLTSNTWAWFDEQKKHSSEKLRCVRVCLHERSQIFPLWRINPWIRKGRILQGNVYNIIYSSICKWCSDPHFNGPSMKLGEVCHINVM